MLEEERKEQRQEILDRLQPGLVIEGQISNIVDFGAFVDLDGIDGLIHISELSWSHVNHPSEILTIGDTVQVKVLDIDRDRQRISLGLKQTQEDPWQRVVDTYNVGDELEGKVTKVVAFGAFVEILDGVEGLVHISELAPHHVENPREIVQPGDEVRVKILEIDSERRRLSLSVKRVEGQVLPLQRDTRARDRRRRPRRRAGARPGEDVFAGRRAPTARGGRRVDEADVAEVAAETAAAEAEAEGPREEPGAAEEPAARRARAADEPAPPRAAAEDEPRRRGPATSRGAGPRHPGAGRASSPEPARRGPVRRPDRRASGPASPTALAALERLGAATLSTDAVVHELYADPRGARRRRRALGRRTWRPAAWSTAPRSRGHAFADAGGARVARGAAVAARRRRGSRRGAEEPERRDPAPRALVVETPLLFEAGHGRRATTRRSRSSPTRPSARERAAASAGTRRSTSARRASSRRRRRPRRATYAVANSGTCRGAARRSCRPSLRS